MRDEPPCESCLVELDPGNRTIVRVFNATVSQVNMNGDPDVTALKNVMDIYGVVNQRLVMDNVLFCFGILKSIQKKDSNG
jgi:hypothetical protein